MADVDGSDIDEVRESTDVAGGAIKRHAHNMTGLTKLNISNFKGVDGLTIDFSEPLTVLIGENGVGKSSVLEAASLPNGVFTALKVPSHRLHEVQDAFGGMEGFERQSLNNQSPIQIDYHFGESVLRLLWKSRTYDLQWELLLSGAPLGTALKSEMISDSALKQLLEVGDVSRFGSAYFHFDATALSSDSVAPLEEPRLSHNGLGLPSVLSWLASTNRDTLTRIEQMLKLVVPAVNGISVVPTAVEQDEQVRLNLAGSDSFHPVPRRLAGHRLLFKVDRSMKEIPASQVSEGTLLTLSILTALNQPGESHLILIDDLDRGLHPRAQGELLACLRKVLTALPFLRIVCTTHSPYLLDHLEEAEVRVLSRTDRGVEALRMKDHPDWERLGASMGLGEFWSTVGEGWKSA